MNLLQTSRNHNDTQRYTNSRIKILSKNQSTYSSSYGFLLNYRKDIYIITTKHGLGKNNFFIGKQIPQFTLNLDKFHYIDNLDIAFAKIDFESINERNIINFSDFSVDLNDSLVVFNNEKYNNTNTIVMNTNQKLPSCIIQKNDVYVNNIDELSGNSGKLAYTEDNKIKSIFIGINKLDNQFSKLNSTGNASLLFLPIYYVKFLIDNYEKISNHGIKFFELPVAIDNNHNIKVINNFYLKKKILFSSNEILYKIDKLEIKHAKVYYDPLKAYIYIDQYIMLKNKKTYNFLTSEGKKVLKI